MSSSLSQEKAQTRGIASPLGSLPASTRVGKVRLAVSDLQASLRFYRDVVGLHHFTNGVASHGPQTASLGVPDGVVLLELEQLAQPRRRPSGKRLGLYHTALLLPERSDLGSLVRHLDGLPVRYGSSDHLVSEALYLVDPDGLTLEIYADRPRSQWTYTNGLLASGVFPLNKADLLQTAREPWKGLPSRTTMGHIHFYVADLVRSSHFYHHAMGLDIVMQVPGALFASAGGYHHHVGYNVFTAGSPAASEEDPRVLSWELLLPNDDVVAAAAARLRQVALRADEGDPRAPTFVDADGIRVVLRSAAAEMYR